MGNPTKLKSECDIALKNYLKANSSPSKSRNILRITLFLKGVLLLLFSFIVLCAIGIKASSFISGVYGKNDLIRLFRLVSTSFHLHKLQPFHDVNTRACLLLNPYHEQANPFCELCENTKHVYDASSLSRFPEILHRDAIPFVVKHTFATPINWDKMKQFLSQNFGLESSQIEAHSHWKLETNQYNLTRALAMIVPDPKHYLPQTSTVLFHQYIFIDGPSSSSYSLPPLRVKNVFLMQVKGRLEIKLLPIRNCLSVCVPVSVVLEPGDAFYYRTDFWNAISKPFAENGKAAEFSIIKMGSFTLDYWERWLV